MIDYILQVSGQNLLQVIYKSGVNRFVGLGDHDYDLTKTQRTFLNNCFTVVIDNVFYYLHKNHPNKSILSQAKIREELKRR